MARRSWEPRSYPIRDPRTTSQQTGRVVNPVRALKLGGRGESMLYNTQARQRGTSASNAVGPVSDRGKGGR